MMVRIDFGGRARGAARALRAAARPSPGVVLLVEAGPHLPFKDGSIDELFVDRAVVGRADIAETLDELWRVSKPGALVHLRLPHASSAIAVSRDARPRPLLTLNTFNHYDPRFKPPDAATATAFAVERARLHLAGARGDDTGLALARGPFARFIEKLANGSRGSQYRFERWFAQLFGGFEEFSVVLAVVKDVQRRHPSRLARELSHVAATPPEPLRPGAREPVAAADPTELVVTSDVSHEAANIEMDPGDVTPNTAPAEAPTGAPLPGQSFSSGTLGDAGS